MPFAKILMSIGATLGISAGIAGALSLFGLSFWNCFLLIFVLHFVAFGVLNYITGIITRYKMRVLAVQELEVINNQSVPVQCAKCNEPSMVPVIVGRDDNEYECVYCNAINKIVISAEAVLPTTPVATDVENTDDILQRQIKKLEENE